MKTIYTAHERFTTGTEIADALTGYGLVLARERQLDVVDIPFIAIDGAFERVQMRVGWLVDMVVTSEGDCDEELLEVDTILSLLARTRALTQPAERASADRALEWEGSDPSSEVFGWDEVI
jgi:hypothetical protein